MKNAIVASVLALGLMGSLPAWANLIFFQHTQTTLGSEPIAAVHCDVQGCPVTTREFIITNDTGTPWTDYHFALSTEATFANPSIQGANLINPAGSVQIAGDLQHVDVFFAAPLADGLAFSLILTVVSSVQGGGVPDWNISGQPSIATPEPASLGLLGIGAGMMALARRRRARR